MKLLAFSSALLAALFTPRSLASQTAYATHFDGIGTPYGGCGVPEPLIGYPHYLALNV